MIVICVEPSGVGPMSEANRRLTSDANRLFCTSDEIRSRAGVRGNKCQSRWINNGGGGAEERKLGVVDEEMEEREWRKIWHNVNNNLG